MLVQSVNPLNDLWILHGRLITRANVCKVIEVLAGDPSQGGNNLAPGVADCGAGFAARAAKGFQASGALRDRRAVSERHFSAVDREQ